MMYTFFYTVQIRLFNVLDNYFSINSFNTYNPLFHKKKNSH